MARSGRLYTVACLLACMSGLAYAAVPISNPTSKCGPAVLTCCVYNERDSHDLTACVLCSFCVLEARAWCDCERAKQRTPSSNKHLLHSTASRRGVPGQGRRS